MFPVFPAQIATFGSFAVNYLILAKVFFLRDVSGLELVAGGISMVLFNLLLRVFDELKDFESDKIHFPNRPLVSGKITHGDLYQLIGLLVCLLTILQVPFLLRPVFPMFLAVMFFSYLMLKWFFAKEKISGSLPLAFLTHHPIVFLHQLYTLSFFTPVELAPPRVLLFLAGVALCATCWEISRKMRGTTEEDRYTTYTKIWGVRGAAAALFAVSTLSLGLGFGMTAAATSAPVVRLAWLIPLAAWGHVATLLFRFISKPRKAPPLRKAVEGYTLAVLLAMLIGALGA
jgi:hypothetical protein